MLRGRLSTDPRVSGAHARGTCSRTRTCRYARGDSLELPRRSQVIDASFVVCGGCRVDHVEVPGCVGELLMVG
jgi:hypothetical protein